MIEEMMERREYLQELVGRFKNQKKKSSTRRERLVISSSGGYPQYYLKDKDTGKKQYLSSGKMDLIEMLAQEQYDDLVLKAAEQELKMINRFINSYPAVTAEGVYDKLIAPRRKLVQPIIETDEEVIRKWREEEYKTNPYPVEDTGLETNRKEIVRSRAELIIADDLDREGAEYHYEKELYLEGYGMVYPDFTILNVRERKVYLWEHLGMMHQAEYAMKNIRKIEAYMRNGYYPGENLILTSETVDLETEQVRIDVGLIRELVRRYCI